MFVICKEKIFGVNKTLPHKLEFTMRGPQNLSDVGWQSGRNFTEGEGVDWIILARNRCRRH